MEADNIVNIPLLRFGQTPVQYARPLIINAVCVRAVRCRTEEDVVVMAAVIN